MNTKEEKKAWWIIEFEVEQAREEMAAWLMIQLGANGCNIVETHDLSLNSKVSSDINNPSTNESKEKVVTLQACFELDKLINAELAPIYSALDEYGLADVAKTLRIKRQEEEDWLSEWKKGLTPLYVGKNFLLCPPWLRASLSEEELKCKKLIIMEPGMAFGTGFHFTTQYCLKALEKFAQGGYILDVGTGSGILAMAASMLAPGVKIFACENDSSACKIALENFVLNGVEKDILLIEKNIDDYLENSEHKFDLILSNLTCEDNMALLAKYNLCLARGGLIIMSGILSEKFHNLEKIIREDEFIWLDKEIDKTWTGCVIQSK